MLVPDPHMPHGERTKLLDFGIAKFTASGDQSNARTQLSAVMGSPSYMSPEQCRGASQVDDRTDVYSLGCMLYEMLCGQPPFAGDSMADLMARHQFEQPVPLARRTAGVPPPLLALVDMLLTKDRTQRPAMNQVLEGLETLRQLLPQIAQRRSARLPTLRASVDQVPVRNMSTLGQSVGQGLRQLQQGRRSLLITLAAALVTLALLAPLLFGSRFGFQRSRSVGAGQSSVLLNPPPVVVTPPPTPPAQVTEPPAPAVPATGTPDEPKRPPGHPGHKEIRHAPPHKKKPPPSEQQQHLILVE